MTTLTDIKGVGSATAEKLHQLGITDAAALFSFLPSRYVDLKTPVRAAQAEAGEFALFEGRVVSVGTPSKRGSKSFSVKLAEDGTKSGFSATFFNQPYLYASFEAGKSYRFLGKAGEGEVALVNPVFEPTDKIRNLEGVFTVYPLRGIIGQNTFKRILSSALDLAREEKTMPPEVLAALNLSHFPKSLDDARKGRSSLAAYDVAAAIKIYKKASGRGDSRRKVFYNLPKSIIVDFEKHITLTPSETQRKAMEDIALDLGSAHNMARIVSGDVGSGKTLVAFFAAFAAARAGLQCAVMAPTEILAEQHARKFEPLAKSAGISFATLTSSTPRETAQEVKEGAADGSISVFFGTQSLISKDTEFKNLALAVIDEQHRFGVHERAELQNKGAGDVLTLTATPIPRSLALAFYDDIAISRIERRADAPSNITSKAVSGAKLADMLAYVAKKCKEGEQAFIVCPSIRDSEGFETLSALGFEKEYGKIFDGVQMKVLHGRMSGAEKDAVMRAFSKGKLPLLVATTVIEVGVDTRASLMCVLAAERFGLASLHQLRGRIGRDGRHADFFMHIKKPTEKALARISALIECRDGAEIAERDFEMRGAGDLLGTVQSGATLTPALGLPLTPAVLRAAKDICDSADCAATDFFLRSFAPEKYADFAERVVKITLNS